MMESMSLARQLDMAFKQLDEELSGMGSGIIFFYIRNNIIGKFGVRHDPVDCKGAEIRESAFGAMSPEMRAAFRKLAVTSLQYKRGWTHGEIQYEFAVKNGALHASILFESNYNMVNLLNDEGGYFVK